MRIDEERIREELLPLYRKLLDGNTVDDICAFCIQWGRNFPSAKGQGILFVGKAVNGWISDETDVEVLFGEGPRRIFARDDQMKWVDNLEGDAGYNTLKSAFWRVIKGVSRNFHPAGEWYSHIAWSNLCKLAPAESGNPGNKLYYQQLETCREILKKEIELFSPKFVVMLTSGWEKDFMYYLNGNAATKSERTADWCGYRTRQYTIDGVVYIVSQHPQGKPEGPHVETITSLLKN